MLNQVLMVFSVPCCLVGAAILIGPAATSDVWLLVGASMVPLGMVLGSISFRTWLSRRKRRKLNAQSEAGPAPTLTVLDPKSQRTMLQIAVYLRIEDPNQASTARLAFTISVNAHGGTFESPVRIHAGQRFTLSIPQSSKELGCRVVQVQALSAGSFATSFEFDQPNHQFWPIAASVPD